jgi:hypothetical protein
MSRLKVSCRKFASIGIVAFCSVMLLTACGGIDSSEQQIDRESIREEMEQREIRRVLPAELVEAAYERGATLSQQALEIAIDARQTKSGTLQGPGDFLSAAGKHIDSLAKAENVDIRWVSVDTDTALLGEKERQLWEAYLYNIENELPVNDNVQRLGDEEYLYTRPLSLSPELRKKIAGSEETESPQGFLGMWSIRISKKRLIQSM